MAYMTIYSEFGQDFNYHINATRETCVISNEDILRISKDMGISILGFSEHMPNPGLVLPDENNNILLSEVDDYIKTINRLKDNNFDMTVLVNFIANYNPMSESFLGEMKKKVDYMILEQRNVVYGLQTYSPYNNPNYPIEYANMVSNGINSGIFDIVAYPDYFMKFRSTIVSDEDKKLFDENAILASQRICETARNMGIPLELDLSVACNNLSQTSIDSMDSSYIFWKVAQEIEGLKILKCISDINTYQSIKQAIHEIIPIEQLIFDKIITDNYNPLTARKNNKKLQETYIKRQENALSFETNMVNQITWRILKTVDDGVDPTILALSATSYLDEIMKKCYSAATKKINNSVFEISSSGDKKNKEDLKRKKQVIKSVNQVLINQKKTIENAKNDIMHAVNIGCETNRELSNILAQITQYQTTQNEEQKEKIDIHIAKFQNFKTENNTYWQNLKRKYNQNYTYGFTNTITLWLLIIIMIGIIIGICFMMYKISVGV